MRYEEMVLELVKARQLRAWSMRRFSVRAGIPHQTINAWELQTRHPSVRMFISWAEELGFEVILRRKIS